jgi:uncharacterized protein (DUF362 family)
MADDSSNDLSRRGFLTASVGVVVGATVGCGAETPTNPGTGGAAAGGAGAGGSPGGSAAGGSPGGGASSGGVPGSGGAPSGGALSTGGTATGGASSGGAGTLGGASSGGARTGGASSGGASTGGASTGGARTGGTSSGGASSGGTSASGGSAADAGTDAGTGGMAGRVVHVHDSAATTWDFKTGWYGDKVSASVVQKIFNRAIQGLTGASSTSAAWAILLPRYTAGQKFAIKVNFNNYSGTDPDSNIDALIEPVNAVIQTLLDFGVAGANICVYDVTNGFHQGRMPTAPFINRCINSAVRFYPYVGNSQPFSSTEMATFPASMNVQPCAIAQCLVDSDYLINLPIMKSHYMGNTDTGLSVTSLGLKHHFGSINGNQVLHNTCTPTSNPNAQVELFKNKHISGKTVLTVADMLYGSWGGVTGAPKQWQVYGNVAGNALVVAQDPIAIDCVLTDILAAELALHTNYSAIPAATWNPLQTAAAAGLGTYEKGDPLKTPIGSGYTKIKYLYIDGVG